MKYLFNESFAEAFSGNIYGPGTGRILMDNVGCNGYENDIGDCTFNGWGNHNCNRYKDVGVSCGKLDHCAMFEILIIQNDNKVEIEFYNPL